MDLSVCDLSISNHLPAARARLSRELNVVEICCSYCIISYHICSYHIHGIDRWGRKCSIYAGVPCRRRPTNMVRLGYLSWPGPGSFWHVQVPARPKPSDNREMAGTQKYVKMLRIDLFDHYIIKKPLESHWNTHIWLTVLLLINGCGLLLVRGYWEGL